MSEEIEKSIGIGKIIGTIVFISVVTLAYFAIQLDNLVDRPKKEGVKHSKPVIRPKTVKNKPIRQKERTPAKVEIVAPDKVELKKTAFDKTLKLSEEEVHDLSSAMQNIIDNSNKAMGNN